MNIIFCPITFQ